MTVRHSTRPYGHYLQSFRTDEVVQSGNRFVVSHVVYRKDGEKLIELERTTDYPDGVPTLSEAIDGAEAFRRSYLSCDEEERAGAAEEVRRIERAWESSQSNFDPFDETSGCNTRIDYLCREADNGKVRYSIVVAGALNEREQQALRDAIRGEGFIPEQVGMRSLQADALGGSAWHEIEEISITEDPTTFPGTAQELLQRFSTTDWDPSVVQVEDHSPAFGAM